MVPASRSIMIDSNVCVGGVLTLFSVTSHDSVTTSARTADAAETHISTARAVLFRVIVATWLFGVVRHSACVVP